MAPCCLNIVFYDIILLTIGLFTCSIELLHGRTASSFIVAVVYGIALGCALIPISILLFCSSVLQVLIMVKYSARFIELIYEYTYEKMEVDDYLAEFAIQCIALLGHMICLFGTTMKFITLCDQPTPTPTTRNDETTV